MFIIDLYGYFELFVWYFPTMLALLLCLYSWFLHACKLSVSSNWYVPSLYLAFVSLKQAFFPIPAILFRFSMPFWFVIFPEKKKTEHQIVIYVCWSHADMTLFTSSWVGSSCLMGTFKLKLTSFLFSWSVFPKLCMMLAITTGD